jgi:2-polyprenyl-3-methyl-5-hydroxy-6-metoxy-1,4-benzoquinol methylase
LTSVDETIDPGMRAEPDTPGYVEHQTNPYRGHWLTEQEVLRLTEPGDRIFEGGLSTGYMARQFVAAGRHVDGAEIDPKAAEVAGRVCDRVWVGDLQQVDPADLNGPYDLLLFADTLEHLADPVAVLIRLRSQVKPNAPLVVSIPNIANWTMRLRLLFGRFRYTERGLLDRTHLRFYTKRTAVEMLGEAGFDVEQVVAAVPVPLVKSPIVGRVAHKVGNLWPSLFAYTFLITARARD